MRRSLAILTAAATAISASAASFAPVQAAPWAPRATLDGGQIEQVGGQWTGDYGGHRHHHRHFRRHHRHHRDFDDFGVFPGFYFGFGFPQAYYRPYRSYPYYGDCFRTWDGQLICR